MLNNFIILIIFSDTFGFESFFRQIIHNVIYLYQVSNFLTTFGTFHALCSRRYSKMSMKSLGANITGNKNLHIEVRKQVMKSEISGLQI